MVSAAANTLRKAWCAGVYLQAPSAEHPQLQSVDRRRMLTNHGYAISTHRHADQQGVEPRYLALASTAHVSYKHTVKLPQWRQPKCHDPNRRLPRPTLPFCVTGRNTTIGGID